MFVKTTIWISGDINVWDVHFYEFNSFDHAIRSEWFEYVHPTLFLSFHHRVCSMGIIVKKPLFLCFLICDHSYWINSRRVLWFFGLDGRAVVVVSSAGITCDCNIKFDKNKLLQNYVISNKRKNKTRDLKKNPQKEFPTLSNVWLKHSAKNIIILCTTSFKIFLLIW